VTAVISGGISTFLEDRFKDFREYVDFVFLNELRFDANGEVDGVVATAYDFEGKADALSLVCARAHCTADEAVFVGERFNDEAIMLHAHLAIAYPPGDKIIGDTAAIPIEIDDLQEILKHVLVD
jgi:phosphoserine phosphatase